MKKAILLASFVLVASYSFSQSKINGIGKIKLGCDTSIIVELGYDNEPTKIEKNSSEYFSKIYHKYTGNKCYLITSPKDSPSTEKYIEYYVPSYKPVKSVNLKGISLSFYDGILYKIQIDEPDGLKEAFDEKYGKHELDLKEEEKYYTNGYGAQITKVNQRFTSTWDTGDDSIKCTETLSSFHDSKGKQHIINFFLIYNEDISNKVRDENKIALEKAKEDEKAKKFSDLDNL